MFATFFHELKQTGVPVTARISTLTEAIENDLAGHLLGSAPARTLQHDPRTSSRQNAIDRFSHLTGDQVLRLVPSR
jgi:hypothetical protein